MNREEMNKEEHISVVPMKLFSGNFAFQDLNTSIDLLWDHLYLYKTWDNYYGYAPKLYITS